MTAAPVWEEGQGTKLELGKMQWMHSAHCGPLQEWHQRWWLNMNLKSQTRDHSMGDGWNLPEVGPELNNSFFRVTLAAVAH